MYPFETTLTIGVTGTAGAGKTVFLTSLLNHLIEHDPGRFNFANGKLRLRRTAGDHDPLPVRGLKPFEYFKWRNQLAHGHWPKKTTDSYGCRLRLRDDKGRGYNLIFVDWPGERLSDVKIAVHDFSGWSDAVLRDFDSEELSEDVESYKQCFERDAIDLATVVAEYKKLLVHVYRQFRPQISPSTFRLSSAGDLLHPVQDAPMLEQLCGLRGAEFAPLTSAAREKHGLIAKEAEQNFNQYKREQVLPTFRAIARCDAVICLVDILEVLRCDHQRYNDTKAMLRDLLLFCRPERNWLGTTLDWLAPRAWRNCALKRVAFVASKADLVPSVKERDSLMELLKSMTEGLIPSHGVAARRFTCAAVVATRQRGNGKLVGLPRYETTGAERPQSEPTVEFEVSEVPEKWPEDWKPGDFRFAEVWPPPMPGRADQAPKHLDLDKVFDFVLNGAK